MAVVEQYPEQDDLFIMYDTSYGAVTSYSMTGFKFSETYNSDYDEWMITGAPSASNIVILGSADLTFGLMEHTITDPDGSYTEQVGTIETGKLYDIRIDGQSIITGDGDSDIYPFVEQLMRASSASGMILGLSSDDYSSGTSTTFIYNVDGDKIGATGVPTLSEMETLFVEVENGTLSIDYFNGTLDLNETLSGVTIGTFVDVGSLPGLSDNPADPLTFDWNDNDGEITANELNSWAGFSGTAPIGSDLELVVKEDSTGEVTTFEIPVSQAGTWSLTSSDMSNTPYDGTYSLLLSAAVDGQTYTYSANMKFSTGNNRPVDPGETEYPEQDDLFIMYDTSYGAVTSYSMTGFKFSETYNSDYDEWMITGAPSASNIVILGSADLTFGLMEHTITDPDGSYTEQVGTIETGKLYDIRIDGQSIITGDGDSDIYPFVEQLMRASSASGMILGLSSDDYSSGTSTTFIYNVDGDKIGATGVPTLSEMETLFVEVENGTLSIDYFNGTLDLNETLSGVTIGTFVDVGSLPGLSDNPADPLTFDWNDNDGEITANELNSWAGFSGTAPIGSDLELVVKEDSTGEVTTFEIPVSQAGTWSLTSSDMSNTPYDGTYSLLLSAAVDGQTYTYSANMKFSTGNNRPVDPGEMKDSIRLELTDMSNGVATVAAYFGVDPDENGGIGSSDVKINFDPSEADLSSAEFSFAAGITGVPGDPDLEKSSIALSMFALPDFQDYETVPFVTFTVDMANEAEQLSLQLSGIVIDSIEQAGVSTVLELNDHKLTTTVVGRDGSAFEGAEIEALAGQFGTNVTIQETDEADVYAVVANYSADVSSIDFKLSSSKAIIEFTAGSAIDGWTGTVNDTVSGVVSYSAFGAIDGSLDLSAGGDHVLATFKLVDATDLFVTEIALNGNDIEDVMIAQVTPDSVSGNTTVMSIEAGHDVEVNGVLAVDTAANKSVGAWDALQALRLAVGLNPLKAGNFEVEADAFHFIAADINQDGKVRADDALNILKYAVGFDDHEAQWVFVDSSEELSGINNTSVSYFDGLSLDGVNANVDAELTAVLIGDVDASYFG